MIKKIVVICAALIITLSGASTQAQAAKVLQGVKPKWVLIPPQFVVSEPPKDALIQVRYFDNQIRASKKGQETFIAQRFKILRPEALQTANLRFIWLPASGRLTAHSILLHRKNGTTTEMLGKAEFQIVQREDNLEQLVLSGLTTAVFAIPGVDVGDEIEFSVIISNRDATLGDKPFGAMQLPLAEIGGAFRMRLLSADGLTLNRKTTVDLDGSALVSRTDTADELAIRIDNPKSLNFPEGAPGRFGVGRLLEYSAFAGWPEISSTFWMLFDKASTLSANSPIRAEIAKIAAATNDPELRALAALKLVQDRVRYVFVGFGAGNYTPATAEQTWDRRYGDCKGKTVLLLAILRELGVPAEAVLVNPNGVDGIEKRLASPGQFNHVLVRAMIGGTSYWLDGTQFNTPKFANAPPPSFRTALPLRLKGSDLETVTLQPLMSPALLELVDIDASAGTEKPVRISIRKVIHGAEVAQFRAALASLAGEDLKRALRDYMRYGTGDIEAEDTSWSYDEATAVLSLKWAGTVKLDWEGKAAAEKSFYLPGAGLTPPDALTRPKEQDQTAPWAVDFPSFNCWVTTMRLPPNQKRLQWTYWSKPVSTTLGGIQYFRQATQNKGVVQTVMSKKALQAELSTAEAKAIETALPSFNNDKSFIFQQPVAADADADNSDDPRAVLDSNTIDWISAGKVCQPPANKSPPVVKF